MKSWGRHRKWRMFKEYKTFLMWVNVGGEKMYGDLMDMKWGILFDARRVFIKIINLKHVFLTK